MSVFESIEHFPVEYLPTGDKALLMAWTTLTDPQAPRRTVVAAILCLEDGKAVIAQVNEFKFEYRWSTEHEKWFDVSRMTPLEVEHGEPDQE